MRRFSNWLGWVANRPTVIINLCFLVVIAIVFFYLLNKPINVLSGWTVELSSVENYRVVNGARMAVYNPGDTLLFTSKSTKLIDAGGTTTRTIVCDATSTADPIEIQLDTLPAGRPVGESPKRDNALDIPDVKKFKELPRICRIVFDITYPNVILWRDGQEHAETERFLVEESQLTPEKVKALIDELNAKIDQLENMRPTVATSPATKTATVTQPQTVTNNTTTNTTTNNSTTQGSQGDQPSGLSGIIKGLLGGL